VAGEKRPRQGGLRTRFRSGCDHMSLGSEGGNRDRGRRRVREVHMDRLRSIATSPSKGRFITNGARGNGVVKGAQENDDPR